MVTGSTRVVPVVRHLDPAAAPYRYGGSRGGVGVILIHGLTASPTEVRPIADYLEREAGGFTLSCPLLPGHGTRLEDLRHTGPEAWQRTILDETDRLAEACGSICVLGVSMGAILAAQAALNDPRVRSLIMLAPVFGLRRGRSLALRALRLMTPYMKKNRRSLANLRAKNLVSYDRFPIDAVMRLLQLARTTRVRLGELTIPTLLAAGRRDRYVPWSMFERLRRTLKPGLVEFLECPSSGHILPHEPDAPRMFETIRSFLEAHHPATPARHATAPGP